MKQSRDDLLSSCFVKQATIKPVTLGGKEITIRELTIAESREHARLLDEVSDKEAIYYAVKCAMVNPTFFTDDELKSLTIIGENLINEVYMEIPLIGKTKAQREAYFKEIVTFSENEVPDSEEAKEKK